ncbi:hypothetical protein COHA_001581 [Chlorella ohadii]|uniref:Uncharacterized protein n=1 Tax=Chlorella ohadii TaxID=2649997 RepID=A0AAD5E1Z1_9CHLO|nr:hypothetical protein COHA_001581 [Chlorella ohadii]
MSVRFTLVDRQLKLFKHGLQALQKIGSELLLEALPARIVLRSINSSLSAYLSAGLLMKHVLSVFRTQRVEKILFDLSTVTCKATITLHCENGLTKSYKLPTMDSEILQATVDKQQFAVRLAAETAAFSRLLASFHSGLEEVTLVALPDGSHRPVHVNSFIDPQKGHVDKSLYTSVQVEPSETFVSFVNSADEATDVTINLKDFKAMLGLCENLGAQEVDYEAELILSTLMESHAGPAAAEAAAAAARGAAAACPAANGVHTPGGAGAWQQQQQAAPVQRPRPSGLVDDGSLWARSGDRGQQQQQQSQLNPLGGDAGPMHMEQDEVSWEEDEALPLSLPPPGAPTSTLPPGAIM